ncbi:hypothetical protein Tco_1431246 [Tanacetum coccineum]
MIYTHCSLTSKRVKKTRRPYSSGYLLFKKVVVHKAKPQANKKGKAKGKADQNKQVWCKNLSKTTHQEEGKSKEGSTCTTANVVGPVEEELASLPSKVCAQIRTRLLSTVLAASVPGKECEKDITKVSYVMSLSRQWRVVNWQSKKQQQLQCLQQSLSRRSCLIRKFGWRSFRSDAFIKAY